MLLTACNAGLVENLFCKNNLDWGKGGFHHKAYSLD